MPLITPSMSAKKLIVVLGASGNQGGGTVDALISPKYSDRFSVRAITRKPDSEAAKKLVARGVEVVKADSDDKDSLVKAFEGAYGVFAMTDYWQLFSLEREQKQGENLVDAAKEAGVQHFVWSTLDHEPEKPDHWESKANVTDYAAKAGIPITNFYTSYFYENASVWKALKGPDGVYTLNVLWPSHRPAAMHSSRQIGQWVAAILNDPSWIGKDFRLATELLSPDEMAKQLEEVSGKKVKSNGMTDEQFNSSRGQEGTNEDLWRNFKVFVEGRPNRDIEATRKLNPEYLTWKTWVEKVGVDAVMADEAGSGWPDKS